ncbi:MAG: putative membrane protein, partial [Planctomycetota bacterium]
TGWVNYFTLILVFIAFVLFVAAQVKTNIKRVLRHPQLTGLVFWCIGHLLANGDSRSLVLFLGLLIWAKLQIILPTNPMGKE